jgi:hypothetical protein
MPLLISAGQERNFQELERLLSKRLQSFDFLSREYATK